MHTCTHTHTHTHACAQVAALSHGVQVASAAEDGVLAVWDATSGRAVHKLQGHSPGMKMYFGVADGGTKVGWSGVVCEWLSWCVCVCVCVCAWVGGCG